MFKDDDIVRIFLRNRVLRLRQKNRSCSVYRPSHGRITGDSSPSIPS